MRAVLLLAIMLVLASLPRAEAQSRAEFDQLVQQLQANPSDTALRERIIKLAQKIKPAPAIPEEARRALVQGITIAKSAKDAKGQALAVDSFNEALKRAPWWGDAYYNLAVAQELAGRLAEARNSLELYLLTGPSAQETRDAQDRIYALEAKEKLAEADAATQAEKAAQQKAAEEEQARAAEQSRWNAQWKHCSSGGCNDVEDRKTGNLIEFLYPGLAEETRIFLIGTVSESGSISWQINRWPCGHFPIDVSVSADQSTLQYGLRTIDISTCELWDDWYTYTLTRQ